MKSSLPDFQHHDHQTYLISACLAGIRCRYDGQSNANAAIVRFIKKHTFVLACPELLGGMGVPRTPCEIYPYGVIDARGCDKTSYFIQGAQHALKIALRHGCSVAILKARSPSCGYGKVYDGSFSKTLTDSDGVFASLLSHAGIAVYTEENFSNAADRS